MELLNTYEQVENYLLEIPKFTRKNQFADTREFYKFLGNPGAGQKIIHVAGTNGKGSVCAYLEGILLAHGKNCGLFTSPHLITMRERMRIDAQDISEQEFVRLFQKVMLECEEFRRCKAGNAPDNYHPTFFEYLFFMSMLWFEEKKPEYLILETGLGGRLDTTNVVPDKELCIITKIAFDHMEYLGNTLGQIAGEKAGIIREHTPVICLESGLEPDAVMEAAAKEKNAELIKVPYSTLNGVKSHEKFIDFLFPFQYDGDILVRVSSPGIYQALNVSMALTAAQRLLGRELNPGQAVEAVKQVKWPCRMEEVLPGVIIDGAHNPDGMQAFLESVSKIKGSKSLLLAVVKDKDQKEMIRSIVKAGLFDEITITTIGGTRAGSAEKMEECFRSYGAKSRIYVVEDVENAFTYSRKLQGDRTLFVAGSLYLAGAVKRLCLLAGDD